MRQAGGGTAAEAGEAGAGRDVRSAAAEAVIAEQSREKGQLTHADMAVCVQTPDPG